jgi:hypothetical protein
MISRSVGAFSQREIVGSFASAVTGNYLGAIVSLTSAFGGPKPDPEQERFNAIMGALREIDKKLTKIIELQVGPAVVWPYLGSDGSLNIRCFLPGANG